MKYSVFLRINDRRNFRLVGLMQYQSFSRMCDGVAVTVDLSQFPDTNSLTE